MMRIKRVSVLLLSSGGFSVLACSWLILGLLCCARPPGPAEERRAVLPEQRHGLTSDQEEMGAAGQDCSYESARIEYDLAEADRVAGSEESALNHYRRAADCLEEAIPEISNMFTRVPAQECLIRIYIRGLRDFEHAEAAITAYEDMRGEGFKYKAEHFRAQALIEQGRVEEAYAALCELVENNYYSAGPTLEGLLEDLSPQQRDRARQILNEHTYRGTSDDVD